MQYNDGGCKEYWTPKTDKLTRIWQDNKTQNLTCWIKEKILENERTTTKISITTIQTAIESIFSCIISNHYGKDYSNNIVKKTMDVNKGKAEIATTTAAKECTFYELLKQELI